MKRREDCTVLIVDDEPLCLEFLSMALEEQGFKTVLTAPSGNDAYKIVTQQKVDLILSDMRMPGGTGEELMDKLKETYKHDPVIIFFTGFSKLTPQDAYHKGAYGMIEKPVNFDILMDSFDAALMEPKERWQRKLKSDDSPEKIDFSCEAVNLSDALKSGKINIGQGGIFLPLTEKFPQDGDPIQFSCSFQEGDSIKGEGIVRWVRENPVEELPSGIGIEFINIDDNTMIDLLKVLEDTNPVAFIPRN